MKSFTKSFMDFDAFVKMQMLSIGVASFSWALIIPIITKLQGTLWATYMISGYLIFSRSSAFISPLFRKIKLKTSFQVMVGLTGVYFLTLFVYFLNVHTFLVIEAILMFSYGVFLNNYIINYNMFIMGTYKADIFRDIQYFGQMIMAGAAIFGFLITAMIDVFANDMGTSIICFMFMILVSLGVNIYNYMMFWKHIDK